MLVQCSIKADSRPNKYNIVKHHLLISSLGHFLLSVGTKIYIFWAKVKIGTKKGAESCFV